MAFFDDWGKKISHAGQNAVQKTKDMTDVARINGLISAEEKKVTNSYFQIGKLYVALHSEDPEGDFEGLIAALKEAEQNISEYRQQIQQIKGVVRCEKCGAEVSSNVAFCSACGAPVPKSEPAVSQDPNKVPCSACGAMVDKGMRFCTTCGKPMTPMPPMPAPAPVPPPVSPAPAPAPMPQAPVAPAPVPQTPRAPAFVAAPLVPSETVILSTIPLESDPTMLLQADDTMPLEPEEDRTVRTCPQCGAQVEAGYLFCTECGAKMM